MRPTTSDRIYLTHQRPGSGLIYELFQPSFPFCKTKPVDIHIVEYLHARYSISSKACFLFRRATTFTPAMCSTAAIPLQISLLLIQYFPFCGAHRQTKLFRCEYWCFSSRPGNFKSLPRCSTIKKFRAS